MDPAPRSRGLASRVATRVMSSRFAGPIARVALVAAGLVLLATIGHAAATGTLAAAAPSPLAAALAPAAPPPTTASAPAPALALASAPAPAPAPAPALTSAPALAPDPDPAPSPPPSRSPASPTDPVFLNAATATDLRRLPGIGDKRANAILALRARLGHFRAVEDLLKVKGIGRAMIKRLRPLVRIDGAAPADAGAAARPATTAPAPASRDDATSPRALG